MEKVSDINLFVASTPYHIIVASAFMNESDYLILENNSSIEDVILTNYAKKNFKNNIIVVDYYRNLFNRNVFKAKKNFYKIVKCLKKIEINKIFIFNDAEPYGQFLFKYYKKSKHCILEEGIGLYNDMYHRNKIKKLIFGKAFFGPWYSIVNRIGEYKYTNIIYARSSNLLSKGQIKKKIIFENYEKVNLLLQENKKQIKRKIWFISQPLVEDEICKKDEYDKLLSFMVDETLKQNLKICLKSHPRENINKYLKYKDSIEIIEKKNVPIELLVDSTEETYLFTISSSAVLNFSEVENINIYFLHKLITTKIDYSNISCDKEKKDVLSSYDELKKIIGEISNE